LVCFFEKLSLLDPEMGEWRIGELEVFDGERVVFFEVGAEARGFLEEREWNKVFVEGPDFSGDLIGVEGSASGEVLSDVGVNIAAGLAVGESRLTGGGSEDRFGSFEVAEMVRAIEKVVWSVTEVVAFEKVLLLGGEVGLGFDDEVNATAFFGGGECFDSRSVAVRSKIEESEGVF
jgi:hypothetical protein